VQHGEDAAIIATRERTTSVENEPGKGHHTAGAGDRFTGAFAYALADGFDLEDAAILGNRCATHFVRNGIEATRDDCKD
ncbi:MAG: PfkB family carbohydrate kinase, partial [Halobacteriaceae archaeon]